MKKNNYNAIDGADNIFDRQIRWKNIPGYVNNSEALARLSLWKSAPENQKKHLQYLLIKDLLYLVRARIKYHKGKIFYEDLLQEGRLGLIKAMQDFDTQRGPNFFKFASWHIKNRIKGFLNWQKKSHNIGAPEYLKPIEQIIDPEEEYENKEGNKVLLDALSCLPVIDKDVIIKRFGMCGSHRHTLRQIGEKYSLSKQRIEQIQSRAILRLKKSRKIREYFCE